jgi:hypothetical protein
MKRHLASEGGLSNGERGGLGDIMGSSSIAGSTMDIPVEEFSPLQRIVLSANGNLQRIVSSYHDSPVLVTTRYNRCVAPGRYERQVDLSVFGKTFARCTSTVHLQRQDCVHAIEHDGVAIGQLFRHLNILPAFTLQAAGTTKPANKVDEDKDDLARAAAPPAAAAADDAFAAIECRFWRDYVLSGDGIQCCIHEDLRSDLFELSAADAAAEITDVHGDSCEGKRASSTPPPSLGDIMAPAATFAHLPPGFTPLQRLLLTANGNVERIISSYYAKPAQLYVVLNHKRGAVHDRQVALMLEGRQLMLAKSTCFLSDERWARAVDEEQLPVGALYRRFDVLPSFTLHAAGIVPGGFWRQYQLRADGFTCEINETFSEDCFRALNGDDDARDEQADADRRGGGSGYGHGWGSIG